MTRGGGRWKAGGVCSSSGGIVSALVTHSLPWGFFLGYHHHYHSQPPRARSIPEGSSPPNPERISSLGFAWVCIPAPALPSHASGHFLSPRLDFLLWKVGVSWSLSQGVVRGKQGNAFRGA